MTFHRAWLLEFEAALLSVSPSGVFPRPPETPSHTPAPLPNTLQSSAALPCSLPFHTHWISPPMPPPTPVPSPGSWWVVLHDFPQSLAAGVRGGTAVCVTCPASPPLLGHDPGQHRQAHVCVWGGRTTYYAVRSTPCMHASNSCSVNWLACSTAHISAWSRGWASLSLLLAYRRMCAQASQNNAAINRRCSAC
jgi:hypothetical protein